MTDNTGRWRQISTYGTRLERMDINTALGVYSLMVYNFKEQLYKVEMLRGEVLDVNLLFKNIDDWK